MVAEQAPIAAKEPRNAAKAAPLTRKGIIPVFSRIKARNLYLTQGLPYQAISAETGLPVKTLQQLAHREGWTALRRRNDKLLSEKVDAGVSAMHAEVQSHVVSLASQHVIRSLERTGDALERTDPFAAKDAQAYSQTAKNLVGIVRDITEPAAAAGAQINVFVGAFPRAGDAVREAKQVTEVSATPIELPPSSSAPVP